MTKAGKSLNYLIYRMQNQGYTWGSPDEEVEAGDAEVLANRRCPLCVGALMYAPFVKKDSYRAFSICSQCGKVSEF